MKTFWFLPHLTPETLAVEFDFWPSDSWQNPESFGLGKQGYRGSHSFASLATHARTHTEY